MTEVALKHVLENQNYSPANAFMVLLFCCQLISVTVMSYFVKCSFPIISAILPMFLNVSFLE